MKYDVFISYSSHDQKIVEAMCAYLEQRHIRCFVAYRDIPRGGSKPWAEHIVNALDESRMMLVAFSENFNASAQVNREIEIASEDKKPILTFRLSNAAFTGAKKYYLKNINWLDAFPAPEKAFDDMYKQVCLLLGMQPVADGTPAPPPPPPPRPWGKLLLPVAALLLCVGIGVSALRGCKNTLEEPQPTPVDTIVVVDRKAEQERETFAAREREAKKDAARLQQQKDSMARVAAANKRYADSLAAVNATREREAKKLRESLADATTQLDKTKKEAEESAKQREFPKSNAVTTPTTDSRAVDLGLSVKWASCNVGATKPEEYGGYYAWGETEEKSDYSWNNYKYLNNAKSVISKYCSHDDGIGIIDNKTTLEPTDDVATVKWGGAWRMPTQAEQDELRNKCTWTWTTLNGVNGYRVTGPNGNNIFLPAAGYRLGTEIMFLGLGHYWSSSLGRDSSQCGYVLGFNSDKYDRYIGKRYLGYLVRPVCP